MYFKTDSISVIYIEKAHRYISSFRRKDSKTASGKVLRFSLIKLALNVASFALIYAVHIPFSFYVILKPFDCSESMSDRIEMLTFYGIARNIVLFRIIIDPIVSFFTDAQVLDLNLAKAKSLAHALPLLSGRHHIVR